MIDPVVLQLFRFCVVGFFNTLFSYSIYCLFLYAGLPYKLASLFAIIFGILFSFRMQGTLVFFNRKKWLFWKFLLSWGVIYTLQITYIEYAMKELGYNAYIIGFTSLPISVALSYALQKFFVFK